MKKGRKWSPACLLPGALLVTQGPPARPAALRKSSGVPLHMQWGGGHVTGPRTPPGHCLTDAPPRRHLLQTYPGLGSTAAGSLPSQVCGHGLLRQRLPSKPRAGYTAHLLNK